MTESQAETPFAAEMDALFKQLAEWGSVVPIRQWFKDQGLSFNLSDKQARFLVDDYYILQESRKRGANQSRALQEAQEPDFVVRWLTAQDERIEAYIKVALADYVKTHKIGPWLQGVYGIGPVLAAGLLAYIDIHKAPTAGHIWQFFGIAGSGQKPWGKGEKRPWSATGKTLSFKIGDCFIKFSNRPECVYGHIYREQKTRQISKNDAGDYAQQATTEITTRRVDKSTGKWQWNAACFPAGTCAAVMELDQDKRDAYLKTAKGEPGSGLAMLHPGHINDRARRYAVKQFLADLHGAWYRREFDREPPLPYPVAHLGHAHARAA